MLLRTEPPCGLLDLVHPVGGLGGADAAVGDLAGQLLQGLDRCTTAGLPIFARWPLISWDSMGADSPRTAASRAWFRPRSSMSRRNSAPSGSPYQLRCSSRALRGGFLLCCVHPSPLTPWSLRWREPREHPTESGRARPIPGREALPGAGYPCAPRGLSSVGRALSLHGRCQGFDSPRLHCKAPLTCGNAVRGAFFVPIFRGGSSNPGKLPDARTDPHFSGVCRKLVLSPGPACTVSGTSPLRSMLSRLNSAARPADPVTSSGPASAALCPCLPLGQGPPRLRDRVVAREVVAADEVRNRLGLLRQIVVGEVAVEAACFPGDALHQ